MGSVGLMDAYRILCQALVSQLIAYYGPRLVSVAVFGSVGRGTPRRDSDIDVLIVAEGLPRGRMARMAEFEDVEHLLLPGLEQSKRNGLNTHVSPVIRSPQEIERGSPLLLDMTEDARILYDKDKFLSKELGLLKDRLKELGARRVPYKGAWYWLLKDEMKPGEVLHLW